MDLKPIKTQADYRAALKEIETLMAAKYLTQKGERLDALATLAEAYEAKHYPIGPLTGRQMAAIRKATGSTSCGKVVSKDRNFNAIFGVIRPYLFASIVDLAPKTPDRA